MLQLLVTCTRELALLRGWKTLSSPIDGLSTPTRQLTALEFALDSSRQPIMITFPSPMVRIPLRLALASTLPGAVNDEPVDDHCRLLHHTVFPDDNRSTSCQYGRLGVDDGAFADGDLSSKVGILADECRGMRRDARWPVRVSCELSSRIYDSVRTAGMVPALPYYLVIAPIGSRDDVC